MRWAPALIWTLGGAIIACGLIAYLKQLWREHKSRYHFSARVGEPVYDSRDSISTFRRMGSQR
jgi:hypothetical protein